MSKPEGIWTSHDARDGMQYPEASDLTGGETDMPEASKQEAQKAVKP